MGTSRYDRPSGSSVFGPETTPIQPRQSQQSSHQLQPTQLPNPVSRQASQQSPQLFQSQQQSQQTQSQVQMQQSIQPSLQASTQQPSHILFDLSPLDSRDEFDARIERCYTQFKQTISNKSHKECQETYLEIFSANILPNVEDFTLSILVAILVDQDCQQSRYYSDIVTFSKDSLNLFCFYLNQMIIEKMSKLRDFSIKQIFWVINELIRANFAAAENICSNVMRQIAGGDISPKNVKLAQNVLDIFLEHKDWILKNTSFMGPTAIYTYMRLIHDHMDHFNLKALRQKEVDFVIGLLNQNFNYAIQIGRDFVRLLYYIVKIPEFEKLWSDIFNNPKVLNPPLQTPSQIVMTRTPRRLVQSRLTFDMERKINFLATQVKFGNHKKYQDWFHKQFLSSHESLSLRCDIIRYICIIIHPSNEVLCSEIIPRWAIIGWILATCTSSTASFNSKLTLFYDWLFYDIRTDSIMNIEPGILLMHNSRHSHPNVTSSSLDFLCRVSSIFTPKLSELIKQGIKKSFQQILEKRVLPSIAHLFDFPKDTSLRNMLKENFPEFGPNQISIPDSPVQSPASNQPSTVTTPKPVVIEVIDLEKIPPDTNSSLDTGKLNNIISQESISTLKVNEKVDKKETCQDKNMTASNQTQDESSSHSWNPSEHNNFALSSKQPSEVTSKKNSVGDSPEPSSKRNGSSLDSEKCNRQKKKVAKTVDSLIFSHYNYNMNVIYSFMKPQGTFKMSFILGHFERPILPMMESLISERNNDERCSIVTKLVDKILGKLDNYDSSQINYMAQFFAETLSDHLYEDIFPADDVCPESLQASIKRPFFFFCKAILHETTKREKKADPHPLNLLAELSKYLSCTGYLLLYYLRVTSYLNEPESIDQYATFCKLIKKNATANLMSDLKTGAKYSSSMFCFLLPMILGELSASKAFDITGNVELIRLIVANIDATYLQELLCLCMTGNARVFFKDAIMPIVEDSLTWESMEQYAFWKLVSAQNIPIDQYISILPNLDYKCHPEAMSCMLLALQKETSPSSFVVEQVFSCECRERDFLPSSILRFWAMKTDVKNLSKTIISLTNNKQSDSLINSEKILSHLQLMKKRAPRNRLLAQEEIVNLMSGNRSPMEKSHKPSKKLRKT